MKRDEYYRELNEIMNEEAGRDDLTLKLKVEKRKVSPVKLLAAAAVLLAIPLLSANLYSFFSYRSLLQNENRAFLNELMDSPLQSMGNGSEGVFEESDWFDLSTPLPLL